MDAFNYILLGLCAINAVVGIGVSLKTGKASPAVTSLGILLLFVLVVVAESVKVSP